MKPGYMTSEFWLSLATGLLAQFGPLAAAAGPKTALVVQGATAVAYTLGRAYTKANEAVDAPPPSPVTVIAPGVQTNAAPNPASNSAPPVNGSRLP
jgi:hypothetical protein